MIQRSVPGWFKRKSSNVRQMTIFKKSTSVSILSIFQCKMFSVWTSEAHVFPNFLSVQSALFLKSKGCDACFRRSFCKYDAEIAQISDAGKLMKTANKYIDINAPRLSFFCGFSIWRRQIQCAVFVQLDGIET